MAGAFFSLLVAALLVCLLSLSQGVGADGCDSCVVSLYLSTASFWVSLLHFSFCGTNQTQTHHSLLLLQMHEGNCVHEHNPDHSDKHISCFLCGSYGHCNRRKINTVEGVAMALHTEDVLQD